MVKALSLTMPVPGIPELFSVNKNAARMTVIKLKDESLCLFSPIKGLSEELGKSISEFDVSFLFAPNHFHYLGLEEYRHAFPEAGICASDGARPRLEKKTGMAFENLDRLASLLPSNITLLQPEGTKNGEVWIRTETSHAIAWTVVDCFAGPGCAETANAVDMTIRGAWFKLCVKDKAANIQWIEARTAIDRPSTIIPCHGAVINGVQTKSILALLNDKK